jgi:hypothetical protein
VEVEVEEEAKDPVAERRAARGYDGATTVVPDGGLALTVAPHNRVKVSGCGGK